jgi:hypothetical protein
VSQKPRSPHYEALIARNVEEALRLRLHRMTSETICRRMLAAKHPALPEEVIAQRPKALLQLSEALWDIGTAVVPP